MFEIRANTQVIVPVGPFVDVTDGFTPETAITLGAADEAELLKHGSTTVVDISAATWAAITGWDGHYGLTLTTSHTDTPGIIKIGVQDDSVCLPVTAEFMVLSEYEWDRKYGTEGQNSGKLSGILAYGTAAAVDNTSITLQASHGLDVQGNYAIVLTGGTNALGKSRYLTYNTGDKWDVDPSWISDSETAPSGTITYIIIPAPKIPTSNIPAVNVAKWLGTAAATPTVAGVPEVDVTHWLGTAAATPDTAGFAKVTIKDGTGTGEINTTSGGVMLANVQGIKKNTQYANFGFPMWDSATPTALKTGLTVTAERSLDGGAFGACANAVSEYGATGVYKITLAAADLNADAVALKFTSAGAVPQIIFLAPVQA